MINSLKILYNFIPRKIKKKIFFIQILVLISAIFEILSIFSIGPFVQLISDSNILQDESRIVTKIYNHFEFQDIRSFLSSMILTLLIIFLLSAIFLITNIYFCIKLSEDLSNILRKEIFDYYLFQSWIFHSQNSISNYTKKISYETNRIAHNIIMPVLMINAKIFTGLLIIVCLIIYKPIVSVACLVTFSLSYFLMFYLFKVKLQKYGENLSLTQERMFKTITETFTGIKEVVIYGKQKKFLNDFTNDSFGFAKSMTMIQFLGNTPKYFLEFIAFTILLLFLFFVLSINTDENLFYILPILAIYILAGYKLLPIFQLIYYNFTNLKANIPAVETVKSELINLTGRSKLKTYDNYSRIDFKDSITFKNVSYTYKNSEKIAVKNINLSFLPNSINCIVGPSGSGKTTILDLLLGLLEPEKGKILIDKDIELKQDNFRKWQNNISFVGQNVFILDDTIKNNICFFQDNGEYDEEKLNIAVEKADLNEMIFDLKEGLDTIVGDRGLKISGGQRQRVAIARAIYHDRDIVIFDEATNSLDGISEKIIINQLKLLSKNKTVFLVSHNIKLTKSADKIYLIENGRINDSGKFEELIENDTFKKLLNE